MSMTAKSTDFDNHAKKSYLNALSADIVAALI